MEKKELFRIMAAARFRMQRGQGQRAGYQL